MFKDVTIGQYYPADSILHRLDPRVKLLATLIYLITVFMYPGVIGFLIITAFLITMIALSHVPFRYMIKSMRGILVLMCITALFNLFLTSGTIVVSFWRFKITYEGIFAAVRMLIRLTYLILGTSLMTLTTTPNQLTDGLETACKPLSKIHFPVHELAMMMSIALRFIPILMEETDKIMKAQMARGANFDEGNIFQKAKALIPLLVPLFVSAFRRANDLAMAMEARCYNGGEGRTKMKPLKYTYHDKCAYVFLLVYVAAVTALKIIDANSMFHCVDGMELMKRVVDIVQNNSSFSWEIFW